MQTVSSSPKLTEGLKCDTLCHMKDITIRELHHSTGRWVRQAGRSQVIVITDHGRPVAVLSPYSATMDAKPLPDREAWISKLPRLKHDSADAISEDRDRL